MVALLLCGTLFAEARVQEQRGERPGRMNPEEQIQQLRQELNLTKEQEAKLLKSFEQRATDAKELRDKGRLNQEALRTEMQQVKEEQLKEMKAILTPEQYVQFLESRGKALLNGQGGLPKGAGARRSK